MYRDRGLTRSFAERAQAAGYQALVLTIDNQVPLTFVNYVTEEKRDIVSLAAHIAGLLDPTLNWRDVDWLRGIWRGPLVLKGVLHPDEAKAALEHGVDGVIVSNHGGRQLDGAIGAIRALAPAPFARPPAPARRPAPRRAGRRPDQTSSSATPPR